jgi:hypothetical protein
LTTVSVLPAISPTGGHRRGRIALRRECVPRRSSRCISSADAVFHAEADTLLRESEAPAGMGRDVEGDLLTVGLFIPFETA